MKNKQLNVWPVLVACLICSDEVFSCTPTTTSGSWRGRPRRQPPLLRGQFVPAVSESTIGASGPSEGRITPDSPNYADLVPNYNPNVIFLGSERDEGGRLMTKRCKDRVDTLAILVSDMWPGIRLRITQAWTAETISSVGSLHYEGRAVDITTSDQDHSKYGILARLAVEAGFDWVEYKSRFHVHASVRSDNSDAALYGGCFPEDSKVRTRDNRTISIGEVAPGDQILAVDRDTGQIVFSDVILLLDKLMDVFAEFVEITTTDGAVTLTKNHLIFVFDPINSMMTSQNNSASPSKHAWAGSAKAIFAEDVKVGDFIFTHTDSNAAISATSLSPVVVISARKVVRRGLVAPLTLHGTLVVDGAVTSCYSVFKHEPLAHLSFSPARTFRQSFSVKNSVSGIHWYAKALSSVARAIFPKSHFRFA